MERPRGPYGAGRRLDAAFAILGMDGLACQVPALLRVAVDQALVATRPIRKGMIMRPIKSLAIRVAAVLVGSAIVGAGVASNPATAQNVNTMVQEFTNTVCAKTTACKKFTNNSSGAGVEGVGGSGNGVIALSTNGSATYSVSTNADGVQAYSTNNDGTNSGTNNKSSFGTGRSGIWAHDDSTDGGHLNVGVAGSSTSGIGVSGSSAGYVGVNAIGGGVIDSFTNDVPALSVVAGSGSPPYLVLACTNPADNPCTDNASSKVFRLQYDGSIEINGLLYTSGSCFAGCLGSRNGGSHRVVSYAPSQTVPSMDDFGEAQLVSGRAVVRLSADFANVVDQQANYLVFITPEGDSRGLYVTDRPRAGFTVRENEGGHSSLAFSYRIVAKPYGVDKPRLPIRTIPAPRPGGAKLRNS